MAFLPPLLILLGLGAILLILELLLRYRARHRHRAWNTHPLPEPDLQALRIVVLGDSLSFGFGLSANQAWPARLAQCLAEKYPQERWQVINASVSGHTVVDAYLRFAEHVIAYEPHLVLIAFGLNDCRRVWRMNDARRLQIFGRHEQSWWGKSYLARGIVNRLRPLPRATVVNETALAPEPRIPPHSFQQLLVWLAEQSRKQGALPVLLTLPPIAPHPDYYHAREFAHQQEYSDLIRATARTHDIPLIEVSHRFSGDMPWLADGVHLSVGGQREIAARVCAALQRPPLASALHISLRNSNAEMAPSLD
jgi:lysophospholipase L1-like esterase